MDVNKSRHTV